MLRENKLIVSLVALLVSIAVVVTGCGSNKPQGQAGDQQKITFRYSHSAGTAISDPHQAAAVKFKESVEKATGGKVQVQIFPGGQLGSEERGFQDVQKGVVQATSMAVNNAAVFSPSLFVFDLPYLFKSRDEFYKVIDENWDAINERMEKESGNIAIAWLEQGFRVITNSKRPVETLSDLQGLKIRVPNNPIMVATFKAWDCEPTPISWDETFQALQQKVVDGQENPYPVIATNKFYEVQKYVTDIHYKMWIGPVVVQKKWLDSLPEDIRKAIIQAGKDATMDNRKLMAKMDQDTRKLLQDKKMVLSGTPKDEDVWMKKSMAVWPQFYNKIPDISLLDKMMKSLGRERPKS